jgi:hypothetical protein
MLIPISCGAPSSTPTAQELTSTPTSTPLSTFTPSPLPTFTPAGMEMPPNFSPILYGQKYDANTFFILLGGVEGSEWLTPDQTVARFAGASEYSVYTFANQNFEIHGNTPELSPPNQSYFIGTDGTFNEFGMVGVAQGWPALQRDTQELSSDIEIYQQVVLDWLNAQGVSAPQLDVLRIFRVDIEDDGVDEIFINSTHLDESQHTTKAGDYSIILMRKVVGNDAVTLPIVGDVYDSQELEVTFPQTYSLANFIDLNQDGVLEVVVDVQKWEGDGAIVYQIDGQEIRELFSP